MRRWLVGALRLQLREVEELGLGRGIDPIRTAGHPVVVDEVPEHEVGPKRGRRVARGGVGEGEQHAIPRVVAGLEHGLGVAAELLHPRAAAPVAGAEPVDEAPEPRAHVRGQPAQRDIERRVDQHVEAGGGGHGGLGVSAWYIDAISERGSMTMKPWKLTAGSLALIAALAAALPVWAQAPIKIGASMSDRKSV